jgi:hypothetical protein
MGASTSAVGPGIGRYGLGVVCLLAIAGALLGAAVAVRRRWLVGLTGALAWLADAVIAVGLLVAELELLGAVGLFRLAAIVPGALLLAAGVQQAAGRGSSRAAGAGSSRAAGAGSSRAAGAASSQAGRARRSRTVAPARPGQLPLALAVLAAAAVLAEWAGPSLESYDTGIHSFDSLWYHLPWAASFAQTGWVTPLRFTDVEYLTAFYPASAEMLHGLGIVALGRDTLSPAINLVWLSLALLAAYCIGRPRGLGPATAIGAALACATPMMTGSQAGTAANDIAAVFLVLAAVALVPERREWAAGGGAVARVALAGLAAGLALAVKLTPVGVVAALSVGVVALAGAGNRRRAARTWFLALLAGGAYWYVRNLLAVGNPLPWIHIPGLPVPAPPLQAHTGFDVAHYLGDLHMVGTTFARGLHAGLGSWWPALLAAALAGPLLCLAPGSDARTRMLGLTALASTAAYLVTPETAAGPPGHPLGFGFNLRYAAPALTLSLAVLPLAGILAGERGRRLTLLALAALLVATVFKPRLWPSHHLVGALAVGAAGLLAVGLLARAHGGAPRRRLAAGLATVAVLGLGIAGYPIQRNYLEHRYAYAPRVSDLARVWALFRDVHDARVAVAGTFGGFFAYPLYGLDQSNRVQYIGAHGPHGSFTAIASCRAWRRAVDAGRFDYLVLTPARDPWRARHLTRSPELAWVAGAAAAHAILRYRTDGQRVAVMELRGRLDPDACRPHASA